MVLIETSVAVFAAMVAHNLFEPKIPLYEFSMVRPPLFWFGDTWEDLKSTLHAEITMMNDNLVQTDVHSLKFDLYFPTWEGDLVRIAHVVDARQSLQHHQQPSESIWSMPPRQLFSIRDKVEMTLQLTNLYNVLGHLVYQIYKGGGNIPLTVGGVTHITAQRKAKATLTIICDTILNTITSKMKGNDCAVYRMMPGWSNSTRSVAGLRDYSERLQASVNGTVLVNGKPNTRPKKVK